MQRADQCEQVAPLAAYFVRFAGMKRGMQFSPMHPDIKAVCIATMSTLEKHKSELGVVGASSSEQCMSTHTACARRSTQSCTQLRWTTYDHA